MKKCEKCNAQGYNRLGYPNEWSSSIGKSSTTAILESRDAAIATPRASRKCSICKEIGYTHHRALYSCAFQVMIILKMMQTINRHEVIHGWYSVITYVINSC